VGERSSTKRHSRAQTDCAEKTGPKLQQKKTPTPATPIAAAKGTRKQQTIVVKELTIAPIDAEMPVPDSQIDPLSPALHAQPAFADVSTKPAEGATT